MVAYIHKVRKCVCLCARINHGFNDPTRQKILVLAQICTLTLE